MHLISQVNLKAGSQACYIDSHITVDVILEIPICESDTFSRMSFDTPNPPFNASDPYATYVNASCFDFLLIELIPFAARVSAELARRDEQWALRNTSGTTDAASLGPDKAAEAVVQQNGRGSGTAKDGSSQISTVPADDESREALLYRLDMLGYRVGLGIAERYGCLMWY